MLSMTVQKRKPNRRLHLLSLMALSLFLPTIPLRAQTCTLTGKWTGAYQNDDHTGGADGTGGGPVSAIFTDNAGLISGTVTATGQNVHTVQGKGADSAGALSFGPVSINHATGSAVGGFTDASCLTVSGRFHVVEPDPNHPGQNKNVDGGFILTTPPFALAISDGDKQFGPVGQALGKPLAVKVMDQSGNNKPDVSISFKISQQPTDALGASLTIPATVTAADGTASTELTLGSLGGTYKVTATCTNQDCMPNSVTFSESTEIKIIVSQEPGTDGALLTDLTLAPTKAFGFRNQRKPIDLYAYCADTTDIPRNPVTCTITLELTTTAFSGGHNHDDPNRPPGEVVLSSDSNSLSANGDGITNDSVTADFVAGGVPKHLIYLAPPVGGDTMAKVSALTGQSDNPLDVAFGIHVRSDFADCAGRDLLCEMPPGAESSGHPYYMLTGGGPQHPQHPSNHFGTFNFDATLDGIALSWFTFTNRSLNINDMSLEDGGIFDFCAELVQGCERASPWKAPHAWHRWGDEADIGSPSFKTSVPVKLRPLLRHILVGFGYSAIVEKTCFPGTVDEGDNCTHYHIMLTGLAAALGRI